MGKEQKRGAVYDTEATTRSPADRDIFGDEGAARPAKDEAVPPRVDRKPESSEAGGVD
jgi:hypothetical protein